MLKLDKKAVGRRIRSLRQARSLRQWQVAERIGTTQPAVHMYEQGVIPEPTRLLELARLGGTTVEWILTGRHAEDGGEEMGRASRAAMVLARRLERYSEQDLSALKSALDTLDTALEAIRAQEGRSIDQVPAEALARRLRGCDSETRALIALALDIQQAVSRRGLRAWRPAGARTARPASSTGARGPVGAPTQARGARRATGPESTA